MGVSPVIGNRGRRNQSSRPSWATCLKNQTKAGIKQNQTTRLSPLSACPASLRTRCFDPRNPHSDDVSLSSQPWEGRGRCVLLGLTSQPGLLGAFQANEKLCLKWYLKFPSGLYTHRHMCTCIHTHVCICTPHTHTHTAGCRMRF